jgi:hypothetical protein
MAALGGGLESALIWISGTLVLMTLWRDSLDQMLAAFFCLITLPIVILLGLAIGVITGRAKTSWGFARPRQLVAAFSFLFLMLACNYWQERKQFNQSANPLPDPLSNASREQVVKQLNDQNVLTKVHAAEELVARKDPQAGELVLPLLEMNDEYVRGRAIFLLGELQEKDALEPLLRILAEGSYSNQLAAIRSLGEIGDQRAVKPLLQLLNQPPLAGLAAESLAKIGDQKAVEPLLNTIEKMSPEERSKYQQRIFYSLEQLTGKKFGTDLPRWHQWFETMKKKPNSGPTH